MIDYFLIFLPMLILAAILPLFFTAGLISSPVDVVKAFIDHENAKTNSNDLRPGFDNVANESDKQV